jgi:5-methylcytosine-specific restriction endonuclease McrA
MRRSKSKSRSMQKADDYFSRYIRARDTDHTGHGECITCGKIVHYSEADAGHFVPRDRQSTRYDERNVNLQCRLCNRFKGGQQYLHGRSIDDKYGRGTADELIEQSRVLIKRTQTDFEEIAEYFAKSENNI